MTGRTPSFVFFGTPHVASETLEHLWQAGFIPALVVTSPDRPRGRGQVLAASETKVWAIEHEVPYLCPERITPEVVSEIQAYGSALAVVVAYGKILPQALLDAFPLGAVNIHYSLLPKYRGASPLEGALLAGDTVTGVCLQKMAFELDSGDLIECVDMPIGPEDTARELRPRLITLGAQLLIQKMPALLAGAVGATPQDHTAASRSGKFRKEDGKLDLSGDPEIAWNKYRAFADGIGTYFFAKNASGVEQRIKIVTARLTNGIFTPVRVIPEGKRESDYAQLLENGWQPVAV